MTLACVLFGLAALFGLNAVIGLLCGNEAISCAAREVGLVARIIEAQPSGAEAQRQAAAAIRKLESI